MFLLLKRATKILTGLIAIAVLTNCEAPTEEVGNSGIGAPVEAPLTAQSEDPSQDILSASGGLEVDALLRSQQSHHILNGKFADDLTELETPVSTEKFDFQLINLDNQNHAIVAKPKNENLIAYAGGINVGPEVAPTEALITCAADMGTDIAPPVWTDGQWSCAEGSNPSP